MSRARERVMARTQKGKEKANRKARTMARARVSRKGTPKVMDRRAKKVRETEDQSRLALPAANQDILRVTVGEYDKLQMDHLANNSSSRVKGTLHQPGRQRVGVRPLQQRRLL